MYEMQLHSTAKQVQYVSYANVDNSSPPNMWYSCGSCHKQISRMFPIIIHKSKKMHKNVYTCQHSRWLPMDHKFQANLAIFNGVQEDGHPPSTINVIDIIRLANIQSQ